MAAALGRLKSEISEWGCDGETIFPKIMQSEGQRVLDYLIGPFTAGEGQPGHAEFSPG